MTVSRAGSMRRTSPRMNLAAPTPPASVVICRGGRGRDWPRAIGCLFSVKLLVERGAFDRDAAHLARFFLEHVDRHELARVAARLGRDAFLHQRARQIVASGLERERREIDAALYPRGLDIVDLPAQEQARERVHLKIQLAAIHRRHQTLAVEHRVLMDESQRHELGEAMRLLLDRAEQVEMIHDVLWTLDVSVHYS